MSIIIEYSKINNQLHNYWYFYHYLLPVKTASDLLHINNIMKRKTQTLTTLLLVRKFEKFPFSLNKSISYTVKEIEICIFYVFDHYQKTLIAKTTCFFLRIASVSFSSSKCFINCFFNSDSLLKIKLDLIKLI